MPTSLQQMIAQMGYGQGQPGFPQQQQAAGGGVEYAYGPNGQIIGYYENWIDDNGRQQREFKQFSGGQLDLLNPTGPGGGGASNAMAQQNYERGVLESDRSYQMQQEQFRQQSELEQQQLAENIASREQRIREIEMQENAATGRLREQLAAERQRLEQQLAFDREELGQRKYEYDRTFGEGVRQFDQTFGEDKRQFDLGFGENQRQFDTQTGMDYLKTGIEISGRDSVRGAAYLLGDKGGTTPIEGALRAFKPVAVGAQGVQPPAPIMGTTPPRAATGFKSPGALPGNDAPGILVGEGLNFEGVDRGTAEVLDLDAQGRLEEVIPLGGRAAAGMVMPGGVMQQPTDSYSTGAAATPKIGPPAIAPRPTAGWKPPINRQPTSTTGPMPAYAVQRTGALQMPMEGYDPYAHPESTTWAPGTGPTAIAPRPGGMTPPPGYNPYDHPESVTWLPGTGPQRPPITPAAPPDPILKAEADRLRAYLSVVPHDQDASRRYFEVQTMIRQGQAAPALSDTERAQVEGEQFMSQLLGRAFYGGIPRGYDLQGREGGLDARAAQLDRPELFGQSLTTPEEQAYRWTQMPPDVQNVMLGAYGLRDMSGGEAQRRMRAVTPVGVRSSRFGYG